MPNPLLRALEEAVVLFDIDAVNRAVEAIRDHDPLLAEAMADMAKTFNSAKY